MNPMCDNQVDILLFIEMARICGSEKGNSPIERIKIGRVRSVLRIRGTSRLPRTI